MLIVSLDKDTGTRIGLQLVKEAKNAREFYRKIISGELNCCAVKPSLIVDPLQVIVAANKAALSKKSGKLTTKTINSELLFNLSTSKNITQSLTKFGVSENDDNLLLVVFDENGEDAVFSRVTCEIDGIECGVEEIRNFSDIDLIKKTYKITDAELQVSTLANSVISRIATKEFGSY